VAESVEVIRDCPERPSLGAPAQHQGQRVLLGLIGMERPAIAVHPEAVRLGASSFSSSTTCGITPFLGDQVTWGLSTRLRPVSWIDYRIDYDAQRLSDPLTGSRAFSVRTLRGSGNVQLSDRITVRNITEYNTSTNQFGFNMLFTYRVNAGTVFHAGYNDSYRQGNTIVWPDGSGPLFPTSDFQRTNQQVFAKFEYLFRY
jgi:hypothetical protein